MEPGLRQDQFFCHIITRFLLHFLGAKLLTYSSLINFLSNWFVREFSFALFEIRNDIAATGQQVFICDEPFQADRAACVDFAGADAHFSAESISEAVGEAC